MSENIYKVVRKGGTKQLTGKAYFAKGHATLAARYQYGAEVASGKVVWEGGDEVIISFEEYQSLVNDSKFLTALQDAGVDNWGGIDYAYEMMNKGVDFDEL